MNETNQSLEVEKALPLSVDRPQNGGFTGVDINALLSKAVEQGSAMEVLKELRLMESEISARRSRAAFDAAMSAFQSECPIIKKTKDGAKQAYKYAPLDDIILQTRELIQRCGFSFSMTSKIDVGWVEAICKITYSDESRGITHSEESSFKVPIDSRNPMMNDPQRYGGSMTFAKRYAFCNGFGILTADEDKDGTGGRKKPEGASSLGGAVDDRDLKWKLVDFFRIKFAIQGRAITDDQKVKITQDLIDEGFIAPEESLGTLAGKRLAEVVAKLEARK